MLFKRRKKNLENAVVLKRQQKKMDWWIISAAVLLSLFGLLMIFDSSVVAAVADFGDKYHFLRDQSIWLCLGIVAMFIVSTIDYHYYYIYSDFLFAGIVLLLIGVFIPGIGIHALGANRWINFGIFILQPAELTKLIIILYLSSLLTSHKKSKLMQFLIVVGLVVGLIVLQPDLGTAVIVLAISGALYFLSGAPLWHFGLLIPLAGSAIGALAVLAPYRLRRVMTFFNPDIDPLGMSYHIRQILLALGSGGIFGIGIGKSRQKYEYLPEANTDSIFAIVGEEIGFIGATLLITAFLFLIWRCFVVCRKSSDEYGRLVAAGIGAWIAVQVGINLSAMVALLPLTGVPLPFVSYGGSNLVVTMMGLGILLNITKFQKA